MTNVTYSVPNISCGHCVRTIQTNLAQVTGVSSVKADSAGKKVEITFDTPLPRIFSRPTGGDTIPRGAIDHRAVLYS